MNTEQWTRNLGFFPRARRDFQDPPSPSCNSENDPVESDGKVKTKLMSMWNNVKYGWTVKIKTNFSKNSPVWLLGKCYHKKSDSVYSDSVQQCEVEGEGIEEFKSDFISRIWLTYRREFPILNGSSFTTDCGWGCMLRSGQMLLAQALVCHFLGREWRWNQDQPINTANIFHQDSIHRMIIKWFGDSMTVNSPLSIHALVALGEASGKKAGDWYGPGSVAYLLKDAVALAARDNQEFREICVYVAQDCAVYIQDVIDLCEEKEVNNHYSLPERSWKSVVLLVPVRLGTEKLNSIYGPCLTSLLSLDHCIGIIGGRPKHSLYFVGFQDDKLIHLDPHYCQDMVDVWQPEFQLSSFHCRSPRKINMLKMDPSCCIGFYCRRREDFEKFVQNVQPYLLPPHEKVSYPMFVFCEGRSADVLPIPKYNIPDDSYKRDGDTDDDLECEEFEIL